LEQELFILLENLSSFTVFSGICVAQSLVFCTVFASTCFSFCPCSYDHCYCLSLFLWPLLLPVLVLMAIVIDCPCSYGHYYCLSLFLWPLLLPVLVLMAIVIAFSCSNGHCYCLSFYLWLLTTPLASSNFFSLFFLQLTKSLNSKFSQIFLCM
jgi:hypothetical protein